MKTILRLMGCGTAGGALMALAIAAGDALLPGAYGFGYRSVVIAAVTGALLQLFALGLALFCYWLATKSRGAGLRRRALALAIWCGSAGFSCGIGGLVIWACAGRPVPSV